MKLKYYIYLTMRIALALISGGAASVLLVSFGVPYWVPFAAGWMLLALVIGAYTASEDVRGRHRVFVFEAVLFGLGFTPTILYLH